MSVYWSEKVKSIKPYIPGEQPRDRKFIKLNTNENPYPPSPKVIEAINRAAGDTLRLYPDPDSRELCAIIAAHYGLNEDEVFTGNGSDEVLAFSFPAFFNSDGSPIHFPDITYSFYPVYGDLWNIPYNTIPLDIDFSIKIKPYLDLFAEKNSQGMIFPNPNAPTGIYLPVDKVRELAEAARLSNKVLIVDEAYIAFGEDCDKDYSSLSLLNEFQNLLLVRTLSKEMSLAGLRLGFALGDKELINGIKRIKNSYNSYPVDRLAEAGAIAAINDYTYYKEIAKKIVNTRKNTVSVLNEMGFTVLPSEANFIFVSPPGDRGINASGLFNLLKERDILVRYFNKPGITDYLRISIGLDKEMDLLLNECREILKGN